MTKQAHIVIITIVIIVGLLSTTSCSTNNDAAVEEALHQQDVVTLTAEQVKELGIETSAPVLTTIGEELTVHGVLDVPPQHLLSINAPLGGIVRRATILPGQHVKKGETLLTLEDPEFITLQEEYLSVSARLDQADRELQRQTELARDNVNARRSLEQATTEERIFRVRKRSLSEQLALLGIDAARLTDENLSRQISIKAPFNGYITEVFVNTGSAVEPNGRLLEMVDPRHLHVELRVFERDAARIRSEQRMSVHIAGEEQERPGHIHLVGTEIMNDRTILVHGHLDAEDPSLRPGTTVRARISINEAPTLSVPSQAIVSMNGKNYVFIARGSAAAGDTGRSVSSSSTTYEAVEVMKGATLNGRTAISGVSPRGMGLDEAHRVVTNGAHRLRSIMQEPAGDHH
jgi:membrane fusion protein, heavy metal efflux system